jgi:uncharacterized protein
MVITLTGATGFIGSRLLQLWPPDQHSLVVLSRGNPRFPKLIQTGQWDPAASEPDSKYLYRSEAVIHLAGEPVSQRWSADVKRRIRDSRVLGTRNLVAALGRLKSRPKVLVSASAIGIYGDRGDELLNENSPPAGGFLSEVCQEWEAEADLAGRHGIRVVKIRIGLVLGPDGGALAKLVPLFRWGLGGRLGDGSQFMSWIHVDDLASMIRFAVENPKVRGVLNGTAPNPVTNAEFTRQLAGAVRRPAILPAPRFGVELVYGEMAQILFFSQRVQPAAALGAGFRFRYEDLKPALAAVVK